MSAGRIKRSFKGCFRNTRPFFRNEEDVHERLFAVAHIGRATHGRGVARHGADRSGPLDGNGNGRAGRSAPGRHGDCEVARAAGRAHGRDGVGREVFDRGTAVGRIRADVRAVRVPEFQAR